MASRRELFSRSAAALAAALPGALLGAHLGLLLFFLNPRIELRSEVVLRGITALALLGALLGGAILTLAARGRRDRLIALLPWGVALALVAAAASQWLHAALFAFYLPPGINSRLLKAASSVSVLALLAFYTALVHGMQRRPYGWRSRAGVAVFALLSLLLTAERRSAFRPPPQPAAEVGLRSRPAATNLLMVAIEGATLDAVLPLAEQGQLPFLATVLRQGAYGRLATLSPPLRVAVWNSMATGAYPFRHGVVSDRTLEAPFLHAGARLSITPWGTGFDRWSRPLGVRRRDQAPPSSAPALWTILEGAGISTVVVGWPATQDGAPGQRALIPDAFLREPDLPPAPSFAAAAQHALALRATRRTVDPTVFQALGEALSDPIREALVADHWRDAVVRDSMAGLPSDRPAAIFVGLPGLLEASRRGFGAFSAVYLDGSNRSEHKKWAQLVSGYYDLLDRRLARLWASLPEPRLLAVVAAHGVREPRRLRRVLSGISPRVSVAGRVDGEADGMLMLLGDNLRSGIVLGRTSLVDVAPTILYGMGQPVPRDVDGRVQTGAFGSSFLTRNPLTFVPSYAALTSDRDREGARGAAEAPEQSR